VPESPTPGDGNPRFEAAEPGAGGPTPAPNVTTVSKEVAEHVGCLQCDYDLIGMARDGVCPECGKPVGESLERRLIRHLDIREVRALHRGVVCIMISLLLIAGVVVLAWIAESGVLQPRGRRGMNSNDIATGVLVLGALIALPLYGSGWWLMVGGPDSQRSELTGMGRAGRLAAVSAAVGVAGAFVFGIVVVGGQISESGLRVLGLFVFLLSCVTCIHFTTMFKAIGNISRTLAFSRLRRSSKAMHIFTVIVHTIAGFPIVATMSIGALLRFEGAMKAAIGWFFLMPVYGIWLIFVMIHFVRLRGLIRAERRAAEAVAGAAVQRSW